MTKLLLFYGLMFLAEYLDFLFFSPERETSKSDGYCVGLTLTLAATKALGFLLLTWKEVVTTSFLLLVLSLILSLSTQSLKRTLGK